MIRYPPAWLTLVGMAIIAIAATVRAGSITATLNDLTYYRSVEVSIDGGNRFITSAWTGQLNWQRTGGDDPGPPVGDFHTFCIEISQDVFLGNAYSYQQVSLASAPELTVGMVDAIEELWGRHYADVRDDDTSAAFQIALWEIVSDTGRRLDNGLFRVRYSGEIAPNYYTIAQNWLNSLDGAGPRGSITALVDSRVQDQITASPLPSVLWTGLLLLAILAGYRIYRWRLSH